MIDRTNNNLWIHSIVNHDIYGKLEFKIPQNKTSFFIRNQNLVNAKIRLFIKYQNHYHQSFFGIVIEFYLSKF